MSITPQAGYIIDPNNPNAVIKADSLAMPGSVSAIQQSNQQPSIAFGAVNTSNPTPIPVSTVTSNQTPISVANPNANYFNNVASSAITGAALPPVTTEPTPTTTTKAPELSSFQSLLSKYLPSNFSLTAPTSVVDQYKQMQAENDIAGKTKEVNDLSAQLAEIKTKYDLTPIVMEKAAQGNITTDILNRASSARQRDYAIEALPVTAALNAAQGRLDSANKNIQTLISLVQTDQENTYKYQSDLLSRAMEFAPNDQKVELQKRQEFLDSQKANQTQFNSIKSGYIDAAIKAGDYATAGKMATATDENTLLTLASQIKNKNPDLQFVSGTDNQQAGYFNKTTGVFTPLRVGGGTGGTTGGASTSQYAGVISTILGSGKFTKDQAAAVTKAINNGEDPITVIKNQAKSILGTEGKDLSKFESAKSAMEQLDSQLQQFYANGGKSGVFSGNFEKTLNNLGTVNDPKLVDIAVQIAASLQKYRNAISGTAYSEQEGKDIASIFPGITKGQILNNTIIQARLKTLNSDIDALYSQAIGSNAYNQIKTGSTAKGNLSDSQFVDKAVTASGQNYNSIISGAQKGEIAVVDNTIGKIGYIPVEEFNSSKYTRL